MSVNVILIEYFKEVNHGALDNELSLH
jgi:hypothetical protein